ncbi:chorismate mutase [Sphingopyxis sp. BSNA05]|uniref:chorismate mutase n=1 Tax=Sphingopyxis sp. BSNA05 TaxID=1236614 RepID=UPI0020B6BBDF|nr:chorismate mutase [Sphingopyxis sp. BSNA05]
MTVTTETIDQIRDMKQLREAVDQLDAELIDLFRLRFACMDAAARIKQDRGASGMKVARQRFWRT